MANFKKAKLTAIAANTDTQVYQYTGTASAVVHKMIVTNVTGTTNVKVTVKADGATLLPGATLSIGGGETLEGIDLNPNDIITVQCDTANGIHAYCSIMEN